MMKYRADSFCPILVAFFSPVLSAVLFILAFRYPSLWIIGFIALIPILHSVYKAKSSKQAFWRTGLFGLIFFGGIFFWLWNTYPLDWAGVEGNLASGVMIFFVWFLSSISTAVFMALWGYLLHKIKRFNIDGLLIPAFLWIILEFLRSYAFAITWAGPESIKGGHWTFGTAGYILSESPFFLSLAGIGGLYLLSFILITINVFTYQIIVDIKVHNFKLLKITNVLLLITFISFVNVYSAKTESREHEMQVAVIQTNFPSYFNLTVDDHELRTRKHLNLIYSIKKDGAEPDIIILPEGSRFLNYLNQPDINLIFNSEVGIGRNEKLIIDSGPGVYKDEERSTSLTFLNSKTGETAVTQKKLLTPNGEYLPYISSFLINSVLQKKQWSDKFQKERNYKTDGELRLGNISGANVGALFCSEVISPILYRNTTRMGAHILVNVASHSVFNNSPALYAQIIKASKTRAAENNRYYIQAGNGVPSFIIDNHGRIVNSAFENDGSVLYGQVPMITKNSLYVILGDWPLALGLFYILTLIAISLNSKTRARFRIKHSKNKRVILSTETTNQ